MKRILVILLLGTLTTFGGDFGIIPVGGVGGTDEAEVTAIVNAATATLFDAGAWPDNIGLQSDWAQGDRVLDYAQEMMEVTSFNPLWKSSFGVGWDTVYHMLEEEMGTQQGNYYLAVPSAEEIGYDGIEWVGLSVWNTYGQAHMNYWPTFGSFTIKNAGLEIVEGEVTNNVYVTSGGVVVIPATTFTENTEYRMVFRFVRWHPDPEGTDVSGALMKISISEIDLGTGTNLVYVVNTNNITGSVGNDYLEVGGTGDATATMISSNTYEQTAGSVAGATHVGWGEHVAIDFDFTEGVGTKDIVLQFGAASTNAASEIGFEINNILLATKKSYPIGHVIDDNDPHDITGSEVQYISVDGGTTYHAIMEWDAVNKKFNVNEYEIP